MFSIQLKMTSIIGKLDNMNENQREAIRETEP